MNRYKIVRFDNKYVIQRTRTVQKKAFFSSRMIEEVRYYEHVHIPGWRVDYRNTTGFGSAQGTVDVLRNIIFSDEFLPEWDAETSLSREGEALRASMNENPNDNALALIYADWLDDHDKPNSALRIRMRTAMLSEAVEGWFSTLNGVKT